MDSGGMIKLHITVEGMSMASEKAFAANSLISSVKDKLYMTTGVAPSAMKLILTDISGNNINTLDDSNRTLHSYGAGSGMGLTVIDTDPGSFLKQLQDTSEVEKYEISEDDYNKRDDTFRHLHSKRGFVKPEKKEEEEPVHIKVGDRCEIERKAGMNPRGTVKYVGLVEFSKGYWIGIQLDEPEGKNNGTVKGKKYFECPDKYGSFAKPNTVHVGNYPERDFEDEIDEI